MVWNQSRWSASPLFHSLVITFIFNTYQHSWLCITGVTHSFNPFSQSLTSHRWFPPPQDYHWQWRSFLTSGFTAVYFLVYAIHYFFSKLQITGLASTILYFGYTIIMALIFFLFTGTYMKKKGRMMVELFNSFHLGFPAFSCMQLQNISLRGKARSQFRGCQEEPFRDH